MMISQSRVRIAIFVAFALVLAACGSDNATASGDSECFADPGLEAVDRGGEPSSGTTITLATHDSFALSEATLQAFTEATGVEVEQVAVGDAGQLVSQAILTRDTPTADVLFGIDNSFLCRGLEADLFLPVNVNGLETVPEELQLDPHGRVTPIDFSDVCVNYWTEEPVSYTHLTLPTKA